MAAVAAGRGFLGALLSAASSMRCSAPAVQDQALERGVGGLSGERGTPIKAPQPAPFQIRGEAVT